MYFSFLLCNLIYSFIKLIYLNYQFETIILSLQYISNNFHYLLVYYFFLYICLLSLMSIYLLKSMIYLCIQTFVYFWDFIYYSKVLLVSLFLNHKFILWLMAFLFLRNSLHEKLLSGQRSQGSRGSPEKSKALSVFYYTDFT